MKENIKKINDVRRLYDEYQSHERNSISRPRDPQVKSVIVFPNYYNTAMSNLGFLRVYELINDSGFISADRAFLQDDISRGIISLEERKRISGYDIIFFSLSYENDFYNILKILESDGIPFLSRDRDESFPILVAGGVITFLNPEPVADIFDLFFVGEGEEILPDFFEHISKYYASGLAKNKREIIYNAGKIGGIYAPSHYEFVFNDKNVLKEINPEPGFPQKIKRRWAPARSSFSSSVITTKFSDLKDIKMIEVARGCKRGCRFCGAGYIYLPLRESNPESVLSSIKAMDKGEKAGFVGFDTLDNKNIRNFMDFSINTDKSFSLSSIRLDCIDEKNLDLIKKAGLKTITLGIETGSPRLKKLINKDIDNEEILSVTNDIISKGILNIKAYFMIGLPYEEARDLDETIRLVKLMQKKFVSSSKINKRIGNLTIAFSPFVPKPWTPLQWENFEGRNTLERKIRYISREIKSLPNITIKINSVRDAYAEAFLARGSRLSLKILVNSYLSKTGIDKTASSLGLDIKNFIRRFDPREILPWDIIDQGITKKYLIKEYKKGLEFKITPQCFEGCKRCGIC